MKPTRPTTFPADCRHDPRYQQLQRHLKLQGLSEKTCQIYARAFRDAIGHFGVKLDSVSRDELGLYFDLRLSNRSASAVSHDVCALKFYFRHVLQRAWPGDGLFKKPKGQRLPDIITVDEVQRIVDGTRCLSYRVFYFTTYSLGLRLSEGLRLQIQDIDAARARVHIRQGKGRKDRLVPLPPSTLGVLRRFWSVHRNPALIFPSRAGGLRCSATTDRALEASGVQKALRRVCEDVGLKKTSPRTACATAMPPI